MLTLNPVIPAAGSQHCQLKSREGSCHEPAAAAKPSPCGLLSQAAGTGCCWHGWFPGVGKPHPCCSLITIGQMLVPVSVSLSAGAELTQVCHSAAGVVQTLGVLGLQLPEAREFPLARWDLLGLGQGFKITAVCARTVLAVGERS